MRQRQERVSLVFVWLATGIAAQSSAQTTTTVTPLPTLEIDARNASKAVPITPEPAKLHGALSACLVGGGGGGGGGGAVPGGPEAMSSFEHAFQITPTPSPTGFSLPGGAGGQNGIPRVAWGGFRVNNIGTSGPVVNASVNGGGGSGPVFLGNGASFVKQADFWLPLNGIDWSHLRTYSSKSSSTLNWQGEGWWGNEMMNITVGEFDGSSDVTVQVDPHYTLKFTYASGSWACNDKFLFTLGYSSTNHEYVMRRADGAAFVFHDAYGTGNPWAKKLKRIEDAYGNKWIFNYSTSSKPDSIDIDVVEGADHRITYSYFSSGDNNGKLQYLKAYKTTTTTSANLIGQVEYVYHSSTSDSYGTTGDLMKVIVTRKGTPDGDGVLSIGETYYYRYWKSPYNSSTNPGADHQLRYVLYPENADRLGSPESKTNSDWEPKVNVLYEYNSNGRVRTTQERLPGVNCGCGGGSLSGTTYYTWTDQEFPPADLDTFNIHCVATRGDESNVIVDMNRLYQVLTWVERDSLPGTRQLIWHFDYGTSGAGENRLTQISYPSACSAYNDSTFAVTLRSSAGLIYELDYDYTDNTYDGYPERIRIKQGTSGTAETLKAYGRTVTERPDLPTSIIEYESTGEANGRTTGVSYSFYDSAKYQIKEIDTTYPSVSTGNNGPGASAVEKQFLDKRTGALRWTLDGEGYVNFFAYDIETGVANLAVVDAGTSSLSTVIDNAWDGVAHGGLPTDDTVPFSRTGSGTALDIDASAVIDWLGRTRKTVDAGGMITYLVYKDDEARVYPAWNTSTYTTLLPIQITKTDKDGRPTDVLAARTSVTPSKDGNNEPTGTETYANSDLATRTLTTYNDSGAASTVDRYHSFPTTGDGTRYTNFYRTTDEYDSLGRLEYVIEDVANTAGAGPPVTYDTEQVTRSYYDFVGRVIKRAQAVSGDTHDVSGDLSTWTVWSDSKPTAEYFYDDPNSDTTPEQGDGDGNLRWVRNWFGTGASDYNNTEFRYDWRNRRCLTIPPLAPYSLVKYDHLDRVTTTGSYSVTTNLHPGDDPATTDNANRLNLSKTYLDEWGRVYRTETYDDPSAATPANKLVSDTYYDRRKLVWAFDPANTGISFTRYDGAGRRIQTFQGTQFDTAKYTSSAPDFPDDNEGIVRLTDYTLDKAGNATQTVTKELNHNDANGMDLTNNNDYIRTYMYHYYDAAHQLTDAVNFGTNNSAGWKDTSTAPTYGSSAPARSDTALVTSYHYDSEGRQDTVTDPMAIVTKTVYDKLGRVTQKEEDDAGPTERITAYAYNGQGSLTKITADLTTDQVTEYIFGDAQDSRWVTKIKYPATDTNNGKTLGQPSDETYDRIVFTYNVDGTLTNRTDQNGTVLTWSYDTLRRKTKEVVTTLGTYTGGSVDGAVRSLTWTYDNEGRAQYVTSHTSTTPDTTNWTDATNQVKYTYNAADKLTKEQQEENGKVVDTTTPAVEYGYGTDYTNKYYDRRDWMKFPDGRKIWYGYTHSDAANTLEDTINDVFNRVGQIAKDNAGAKGDLLAEYDHNGMGRVVRRVHDEATGAYGNDTRMDLWHGTTGQYDGLDRFGRTKDMKHTDFNGTAADFLRRKYTYDRNGNRLSIEDPLYKADSQSFTYDNLNRLRSDLAAQPPTIACKRGILNTSNVVYASDVAENYSMDLLGNFYQNSNGIALNSTTATVAHGTPSNPPNATNEVREISYTTTGAAAAIVINEPFTNSLNPYWSQNKGTWSVSSGKVNVDTLSSGDAVLLADAKLDMVHYKVGVTFPTGSSTKKAGIVFLHDGNNSYYAVAFDRNAGVFGLYQITNGTWSTIGTVPQSISDNTAYTITVFRRQKYIWAGNSGSTSTVSLWASSDLGTGEAGLYSNVTGVTFDDFQAYLATARDALRPPLVGAVDIAMTSRGLEATGRPVTKSTYALVERFSDDDYMVQANLNFDVGSPSGHAYVMIRHRDFNNFYYLDVSKPNSSRLDIDLIRVSNGTSTTLESGSKLFGTDNPVALKIKVSGSSIKAWLGATKKIDSTDSTHPAGEVGLWTYSTAGFASLKIGYDNNADDDIDDTGDDIVVETDFSPSTTSIILNDIHTDDIKDAWDPAGNLVDDGRFRYVYDAWNRLVKVQSSKDGGTTVAQTAKFDGLGRRIKKVVTKSAPYDATTVYLYDGQRIAQINNGSGTMVQQFIHGTQYIDELVMVRVKDKGDLYVHQDANWNVIGLTDLGRHVVERYVYTPYGELSVYQDTSFGDRDGDGDVDSTDKGTVGTTCTGTVTGACRILDLDFDGDYDSADATKFDALAQGLARHPGRIATSVSQPFAHQGLLYEPELAQYQNRARQYDPARRRFAQRNSIDQPRSAGREYRDGLSLYMYVGANPLRWVDPSGLWKACYGCGAYVSDPGLIWDKCRVSCALIKCYTRDIEGNPDCPPTDGWNGSTCNGDCSSYSGPWMVQSGILYGVNRSRNENPSGGWMCAP
jgi:RHS repeat-associated protein